jgi:PPOX class probable F420-dependent enzyme
MPLSPTLRELIAAGPRAHLVTLRPDGSPRPTMAWVGLDGDEIVIGTLFDQPKLHDIRRDPRVALSFLTGGRSAHGLDEYVALHGTARLTEGGAAELLQRLAHVYLGPDVRFPAMPDPPAGWIIRIAVERATGIGPGSPRA